MPESEYEVEYFVRAAHESGQKLRVVSETHHALKLGVLQHDALIMCSVYFIPIGRLAAHSLQMALD